MQIISKDNQYLKLARSLRQKKARDKGGCFLIEGLRLAEEALNCRIPVRFALLAETAQTSDRLAKLICELEKLSIPVYRLAPALLADISATEHSQGIALIAAMPEPPGPLPEGICYALCDNISDPGNLGAIIRSAYAAHVSALILGQGCADAYNPKVVRAAMGALFRLPIFKAESDAAAYQLVKDKQIYITAAEGLDIRQLGQKLQKPHLWVLGSEAAGVSPFWQAKADAAISLPMRQGAESLNVAAAAAVLFYQSFFSR